MLSLLVCRRRPLLKCRRTGAAPPVPNPGGPSLVAGEAEGCAMEARDAIAAESLERAETGQTRKRAVARAIRNFVRTGSTRYRGHLLTTEAQLTAMFGEVAVNTIRHRMTKGARGNTAYVPLVQRLRQAAAHEQQPQQPEAPLDQQYRPPQTIHVMTYNPRSLVQAGRLQFLLKGALRNAVDVFGLPGTCSAGPRKEFSLAGYHVLQWGRAAT
eukprot:1510262-Amphidinium_carterae.1